MNTTTRRNLHAEKNNSWLPAPRLSSQTSAQAASPASSEDFCLTTQNKESLAAHIRTSASNLARGDTTRPEGDTTGLGADTTGLEGYTAGLGGDTTGLERYNGGPGKDGAGGRYDAAGERRREREIRQSWGEIPQGMYDGAGERYDGG